MPLSKTPIALGLIALALAGCDRVKDCSADALWYPDADGDGYGDATGVAGSCEEQEGLTQSSSDCDDEHGSDHPGAVERCDGRDNDCDGEVDEGLLGTWYADQDGDGYGDPESPEECVEEDEQGSFVQNADDCDDADASSGAGVWYADRDQDGFGDAETTWEDCESAPTGYVGNADDCDDGDGGVWPGAPELCDGRPNDCETYEAWVPEAEADTAAFQSSVDGAWTDLTATLGPGHAGNIIPLELSESGTLYLCEGTWYAELIATADELSVVGPAGSSATVLDGGDYPQHRLITADSTQSDITDTLAVQGLTLRGGDVTSLTDGQGGGLLAHGPGSVTLEDVVVEGCAADQGGGIALLQRDGRAVVDATFTDVELRDNSASAGGGGAYLYYVELQANDWRLTDNVAQSGAGGGAWAQNSVQQVADLELSGNDAVSGSGGGMYAAYGSLSCDAAGVTRRCITATGNSAGIDGGGLSLYYAQVELEDLYISNNDGGSGSGGGVDVTGGQIAISDSELIDNVATTGGGLGLTSTTFFIANTQLTGNAANSAGALRANSTYTSEIESSAFRDNSSANSGGALVLDRALGRLTLRDTTLSGNEAGRHGSAIYMYVSALDCEGCEIYDNTSVSGDAAVYFETTQGAAPELRSLNFVDSAVYANTAPAESAQAIYAQGEMTLSCTGDSAANPSYGFWAHTGGPTIEFAAQSSTTRQAELDLCDFGATAQTENDVDLRCWESTTRATDYDYGDDETSSLTCH